MRGQAGTPAITWPVIDTGNLGGRVRCQHTAALPNVAAADVASQERRELWPRLRGHVTQPASRPLHKKVGSCGSFLSFFCFPVAIFKTSLAQRIQVWEPVHDSSVRRLR